MSMKTYRAKNHGKRKWGWALIGFCLLCIVYIVVTDPKSEETAIDGQQVTIQQQPTSAQDKTQTAAEYYANYRLDRENVRSQQLEMLQKVADDEKADNESRKDALQQIMNINNALGQELQLEKMITAKTGQPAAVFMQNDKVTVVTDVVDIDKEVAIQIGDMVKNVTGLGLDKVIVVPRKGS